MEIIVVKSFVILYLFFGSANVSTLTSEKFDTMEQCEQAFASAKASFGSYDGWGGAPSSVVDLKRSRCVETKVEAK